MAGMPLGEMREEAIIHSHIDAYINEMFMHTSSWVHVCSSEWQGDSEGERHIMQADKDINNFRYCIYFLVI